MLRGLYIRQLFVLADWLLILLIVVGAGYALTRVFGQAWTSDARNLEGAGAAPEEAAGMLAQVNARSEYDAIMASGLFGTAGQVPQAAPSAEPEPVKEEETQLRLKLCGTSATSPRDLYASAIILNEENNLVRTFGVGQQVVDNVLLEEVYARKVVLLNKRETPNRREVLRSEEGKEAMAAAAAAGPGAHPAAAPASTPNRVTIKKDELVQELFVNYADIVTQIKPEPYRDDAGKVTGFTASNLNSIPLAKKLGVQDGDVLQTVNNEVIDSEEKVIQIINKYRNSNTFRIGILRGGKPMVVTYKLE